MRLSEFDYNLPKELIAQYPVKDRDSSRLMVLNRENSTITGTVFKNITDCLRPGDLLVLNNTKVLLTNFHLPRTTLFMLACAFGGKEFVKKAYKQAIEEKYRFYSYGDAMLIM